MGLPGFIATPLKCVSKFNSFISLGIKSNLPAEIAPDVTNMSMSELSDFFSYSLSLSGSSSLIIPPSII